MAQFDICPVRDAQRDSSRLFVVVLQHDFAEVMQTRIVAPLAPEESVKRVARIHPMLSVEDRPMLIMTERIAAVSAKSLGPSVGSASHLHSEIMSALDLLFLGF